MISGVLLTQDVQRKSDAATGLTDCLAGGASQAKHYRVRRRVAPD